MSVSITNKYWWTQFYSCAMVVSTVDACPLHVLFYILVNRVRDLVLLTGGVLAVCVRDLVLCAGAVVLNVDLCLLFLCLRLTIVDCYNLGTDGVDIVGNWVFGCVIDLVCRVLLLLVYSGTLKIAVSNAVVASVAEIYVLCCIARYVI